MIFIQRSLSLPDRGIERHYAAVRRPGLRIHALRLRGAVFDTRPLMPQVDQLFPPAWSVGTLQIVLRGGLVVRRRHAERTVAERRLIAEGLSPWDERWEGDFDCLAVEWDGLFGPPLEGSSDGSLSAADLERLVDVHRRLLAGEARGEAAAALAGECGLLLRSLGLPLSPWEPPSLAEAPAGAQQLSDALSGALSALHTQPQWLDLEAATGGAERNLRRRLSSAAPWIELSGGSFRRRLRTVRALNAVTLLGAPGLPVGDVARVVGYGSSRAMHLALTAMGLGSPTAIRAAIKGG